MVLLVLFTGCKSLQPTPTTSFSMRAWVGETARQPIFWTNTGTNGIQVDLIDLNGDPPFSLFGLPSPPGVVPPGGTTPLVAVVFAPQTPGTFEATMIPSSLTGRDMDARELRVYGYAEYRADVDSPYMVGRPAPVPACAAAHKIDFGDIVVGTTSYRTVTLRNRNRYPQTTTFEFGANSAFSAAPSSSAPSFYGAFSPANGQLTIIVMFKPQVTGAFLDTLTFGGACGVHFQVDLEGRAHPG